MSKAKVRRDARVVCTQLTPVHLGIWKFSSCGVSSTRAEDESL